MPNGNRDIEGRGLDAVIRYEAAHGRDRHERVNKVGYDLITRGGDEEERHIEVKSTSGDRYTYRWLEPLEFKMMVEDEKWYLYLVVNVRDAQNRRIFVYNKEQLLQRMAKVELKYGFNFRGDNFNNQ